MAQLEKASAAGTQTRTGRGGEGGWVSAGQSHILSRFDGTRSLGDAGKGLRLVGVIGC